VFVHTGSDRISLALLMLPLLMQPGRRVGVGAGCCAAALDCVSSTNPISSTAINQSRDTTQALRFRLDKRQRCVNCGLKTCEPVGISWQAWPRRIG
jgi:hypothetical protein